MRSDIAKRFRFPLALPISSIRYKWRGHINFELTESAEWLTSLSSKIVPLPPSIGLRSLVAREYTIPSLGDL